MGVGLLDSQPLLPQAAPAAVAVPQSHKRCRPRSACRGGAQETKTPTKKVKKEEEMSSAEEAALQKAGPMPTYVDKVLEKLDAAFPVDREVFLASDSLRSLRLRLQPSSEGHLLRKFTTVCGFLQTLQFPSEADENAARLKARSRCPVGLPDGPVKN